MGTMLFALAAIVACGTEAVGEAGTEPSFASDEGARSSAPLTDATTDAAVWGGFWTDEVSVAMTGGHAFIDEDGLAIFLTTDGQFGCGLDPEWQGTHAVASVNESGATISWSTGDRMGTVNIEVPVEIEIVRDASGEPIAVRGGVGMREGSEKGFVTDFTLPLCQ